MEISKEDFNLVIRLANEAGKRGSEINIQYFPPTSATQRNGIFITDEYRLTATGEREL